MKSLRTRLNAEVDVVSVPNGAYRSFTETLSSVVKQVVRKTNNIMYFLLLVGVLVMQVTDVGSVDKIMVKISGDGAKFSSSSSFLLLTFSLPGTSENVLSSAGMCMFVVISLYANSFIQCTSGNHMFAAIRGKESYQLVGALSVVIGEINSLVASESLAVLPGVKVEVVLGGDYKVCTCIFMCTYRKVWLISACAYHSRW